MTSVPVTLCAGNTAATPSLTASLPGLRSELRELMSHVACELSSLAGSLQPISAQAREVTTCCRRAAEISSASQSGSALDVLQQLLTESEQIGLLQTTSRDHLRAILGHLEASRAPLSNLVKLPFLLNTVGMLARIEAHRVAGTAADVSSLAEDISSIARKIEAHVAAMAEQGERLPALVGEGLRHMDEVCGAQRQEATELKANTLAVLDPLRARAERARQATRDIDERYKRIRSAIEGIVMSLQCEDIARQRLEHVQQALEQLSSDTRPAGGQATAGVLALQRAQLLGTRDLVANSISSFLASLRSLISNVSELTAEVEALANQTGEDGRSFSVAMEEGLQAVSAAQNQYSASTRTVLSAVEKILPPVASMTKGATELRSIAASIRRTALNARIETSHLGAEGATMRALAAEVQHITEGSEGEAHRVLDHLRAADNDLNSISAQVSAAGNARIASADGNGCAEVVRLIESVKLSGQHVSGELSQILHKSEQLRSQLEATVERAERCARMDQDFDGLTARLDSVLAPLAGEAGIKLDDEAASQAAGLNELYSMQSEREIHEQLFGTGAAGGVDAGNDVELF